MQKYFRVKGEGEVNVLKRVYPNTMIQIKRETKEFYKEAIAPCYVMQDNNIREI